MNTVDTYLSLIPAMNRQKPKFIAMCTMAAESFVGIQGVTASMIPKFDIDSAVGEQLDILGEWIGRSRNVNIPVTGVYFEWDSPDLNIGWDLGSWEPPGGGTTITQLPDTNYRQLLYGKIAANKWDGTTDGAYDAFSSAFPDLNIVIQDYQDMSYDLAVIGGVVDSITQALIIRGYLPLKPEGVKVNNYYVPDGSGPAFGWNVDSDFVKGWNEGSWLRRLTI